MQRYQGQRVSLGEHGQGSLKARGTRSRGGGGSEVDRQTYLREVWCGGRGMTGCVPPHPQESDEDKSDYNLVVDEVRCWGWARMGGRERERSCLSLARSDRGHMGRRFGGLESLLQRRWGP